MLAAETGHLEVVCWLHKLVLNLAVEVVARPPCRISVGRAGASWLVSGTMKSQFDVPPGFTVLLDPQSIGAPTPGPKQEVLQSGLSLLLFLSLLLLLIFIIIIILLSWATKPAVCDQNFAHLAKTCNLPHLGGGARLSKILVILQSWGAKFTQGCSTCKLAILVEWQRVGPPKSCNLAIMGGGRR